MDVLNYLNSKDVRQHLKNIGYRFAPLDAAKVIENCEHIAFDEKHEAFSQLINETRDEIVTVPEEYICDEKETTLHTLLKNYIATENEAVSNFYKIENAAVYVVAGKDSLCAEVYTDFQKELCRFINIGTDEKIVFTKKNLSTREETSVCFDKRGNILWVQDLERCIIPYTILRFDYGFSETVPYPFEVGDIVIPSGKYTTHPVVITKFNKEIISGYSFENGRLIESELYLTAADIEYYPEKDAPILKVVSDYIKGKSELHTFINMYHKSALEGYAAMLG